MAAPSMTPAEVEASAALGNRIARGIPGKARYAATIRHLVAVSGEHDAKRFARDVLCMSYAQAGEHVRRIMASKPNDIVSPHWSL